MKDEKVFILALNFKLDTITCDLKKFLYENQYQVISESGWTGFYDWLRNNEGKIIGVRYFPFEKMQFICDVAKNLPYATASNIFVEFYFSLDKSYVPELSDDQQFTKNWLLESQSGKYAITFGMDTLSENEKRQLQAISESREAVSPA